MSSGVASPPRLLSTEAAEAYTGISRWTLRTLANRGVCPVVRIDGLKRLYWDRRDLDKLIDRFRQQEPA